MSDDVLSDDVLSDDVLIDDDARDVESAAVRRAVDWQRTAAFVVLPVLVVLLAAAAGFFGWQDWSRRGAQTAAVESVAAARDTTVMMLSYKADTVEKDLNAARDRLAEPFLAEYAKLVNEVVIPGAKEKKISSTAQVQAAGSVSATAAHAVALLFVNQTVTIGKDAPTSTASSVRVTLEKVGGRWMVSGFEPV